MPLFVRILLSFIIFVVWGWFEGVANVVSPLVSGPAAALQFDNSNASYLISYAGMQFSPIVNTIISLVSLAALFLLWIGPLRRAFTTLAAIVIGASVLMPSPASAFFDSTNKTEAYTILPNESAFWIPDVGDNKDTQAKFDSEDFLNDHKVALKRFSIPHQKLVGSAGTGIFSGWDAYVPTGRLIIVDRTPYSREWVDATDRGTAATKQGFPCQSKEGLNITVGVSIGAEVTEAEAAKYLYHFGVQVPQGNRAEPSVIFTSVYYSRLVANVMDDVGRKKVQTLVCNEISKRTFDETNSQANQIMDSVRTSALAYFASVGVTLDFIGWANTFEFDEKVQDAVNRRYIAVQDQIIAAALAPYADTIEKLAAASALRDFGGKTDGKLPTTIVGLPSNLGGLLSTLLSSQPGTGTTPAPTTPVSPTQK